MNQLKAGLGLAVVVLSLQLQAADPRQFGVVAEDTSRTSVRFRMQEKESPRGPRMIEVEDKTSFSIRHAQYFSVADRLAYMAIQVPYVTVEESFKNYRRPPAEADGIGDVMIGMGIGVYRMPALDAAALKNYDRNGFSSGCAMQVAIPTASYVKNQSTNITNNRWMVMPECQLGWTQNQWLLEGTLGMNWFSDNTDYYSGTFEQENIYRAKVMASYSVVRSVWVGATLEYQNGGEVTRGGRKANDSLNNWLAGAAMNFRLPGQNSLRFVGEWPISTAKGASESKEISVVFSHVW
ncbi:transporter [Deefgea tanakiae]|uniref:Transporter n=1 Tax=Deefgea tanakiae TaxID=2865840 RepID=A0ABX8Z6S7_9NEIS|nr:transporter [Deefgea tanakiae]QZA78292.1 transporter [Deefgea tanakiae]